MSWRPSSSSSRKSSGKPKGSSSHDEKDDLPRRPSTAQGFRHSSGSSASRQDLIRRSATPAVGSSSRHGSSKDKSKDKDKPFPGRSKKPSKSRPSAIAEEDEEEDGGGASLRPGKSSSSASRARRLSDDYGELSRPSIFDDGRPIIPGQTVIPDIYSPAHNEFAQAAAEDTFWTWDQTEQNWFHRYENGEIIWAERSFV